MKHTAYKNRFFQLERVQKRMVCNDERPFQDHHHSSAKGVQRWPVKSSSLFRYFMMAGGPTRFVLPQLARHYG